jgi:multidrug efflux pump subunit AcrA (membrane-fusion protein)
MTAKLKKKRKIWIIWLFVAILLAAGVIVGPQILRSRLTDQLLNVRTVAAATGTIEKTVTGTGNISAKETTEDVMVLSGLTIDQVLAETGDIVNVGDIVATFDAAALQKAVWDAQDKLDSLDTQLNMVKDRTEPVYIQSAIAGRVKQIFVAAGDSVAGVMARDGALMMLSLDGKMAVTFVPTAIAGMAVGDAVDVRLSDGTTPSGTIRSLSALQCVVTISDKTAPVNDPVTVLRTDGAKLGEGRLAISQPLAITGTDGTVGSILRDLNAAVSMGTRLLKLEAAPASQAAAELYAQRQDQAQRLNTLIGYASKNALTTTSSGTITAIKLTAGQMTGSAAGSAAAAAATSTDMVACVVRTASDTRLSVLATGQKAKITLDALAGRTFAGTIVEIADTGTVSQGGTTFKVLLDLPEDAALKLGMSATAVITVERRENIVKIPLEALQELGNEQFVYVGKAVDVTSLGDKRIVSTGISDGQFVEIRSGLTAGENINYYLATGASNMFPFANGMGNRNTTGTTAVQQGASSAK